MNEGTRLALRALRQRYEVEEEIGRGGMATVFKARDLRHEQVVALKILRDPLSHEEEGIRRFQREIRTMRGLTHPYILPVLGSGSIGGVLYYAMPYVRGESLRDLLQRERQLAPQHALRMCREIAEALDYAHSLGVVHRDLKPDNVLVSEGHAVIADFGISKAIGSARGESITSRDVVLGTPAYMGPEQAAAADEVDGRTDVYSLGCTLYEMLAGDTPYRGPTAESVVRQHMVAPLPDVRKVRPAITEEISAIVRSAMAKSPSDRFQTAGEMARALQTAERGLEHHRSSPVPAAAAAGHAATSAATVESTGARSRGAPSTATLRRIAVGSGAILMSLVATLILAYRPSFNGANPEAGVFDARPWVWVAEFEGPATDPVIAELARGTIASAIDAAGVVATVPGHQVREALRLAHMPDTTRVGAEKARELAYRSAVRSVVSGTVRQLGTTFAVTVRAVDVDRDSLLFTRMGEARSKDELLPLLIRLGHGVSGGLAGRYKLLQRRRFNYPIETPVFEAYRRNLLSNEAAMRGHYDEALAQARAAIQLDPEFALAYGSLSAAYGNLGMEDSSRWALRQAMRYPDRLSEFMRVALPLYLETDAERRIPLHDRLLRMQPNSMAAWNNRGTDLGELGDLDAAVESFERARKVAVFGVPEGLVFNEVETLIRAGREAEAARFTTDRLTGALRWVVEGELARRHGRYEETNTLMEKILDDPRAPIYEQFRARLTLASVRAAEGEIGRATEALESARRMAMTNDNPTWQRDVQFAEFLLAVGIAEVCPGAEPPVRSVPAGSVSAALWLAGTGRDSTIRSWIDETRLRESSPQAAQVVDAWCALGRNDWDGALVRALPLAQPGRLWSCSEARPLSRWICAKAFAAHGDPDSALAYLEMAAAAHGMERIELDRQLMLSFAVHFDLARLYLNRARYRAARAQLDLLRRVAPTCDPSLSARLASLDTELRAIEATRPRRKG